MDNNGSSSGSTPLKANPSSRVNSSQTLENINPFIKSDLDNHETKISFKRLVAKLCDIDESQFDNLVQAIRKASWLNDPCVRDAAVRFCQGVSEEDRYEPFAELSNHILRLAKEDASLAELEIMYPISDGVWCRSDPIVIQRHKQHGRNGAERKPDVVYLRRRHLDEEAVDGGKRVRKWFELILYCEHKEPGPAEEKGPIVCSVLSATQSQGISNSQQAPLASQPHPLSRLTTPSLSHEDSEEQPPSGRSSGKRKRVAGGSQASAVSGSSAKRARQVTAPKNARVQAAGYALEILSNTDGSRSHCIGLILFRQDLSIWYYDASGIVTTAETIPIIDQFETFAAIIISLARCTPKQLGATPKIDPPAVKTPTDHFPPETMEGYTISLTPVPIDGGRPETQAAPSSASQAESVPTKLVSSVPREASRVTVTLGRPIFSQYALVGRHTIVYRATSNGSIATCPPGTALVVKISQQVSTRPRESDLLNEARNAGVKNLPELHLAEDLWNLDDGLRGSLSEAEQKNYEARTLRALVYTEYQALDSLFSTSAKYLGEMVYQMLDCLHDLRHRALILHRDISFNNIMVLLDGPDGKPLFILNDFDLATRVTKDGQQVASATSKHRTGTLPFMAWEVLYDLYATHENVNAINTNSTAPHRLRYDFESLLYVAMWCASQCEPVSKPLAHTFAAQAKRWELGAYQDLYLRKSELLGEAPQCNMSNALSNFNFTPRFEPWREWFEAWLETVAPSVPLGKTYGTEAYPSKVYFKKQPDFDYETMKGVWTRDAIVSALRSAEPTPLPE
ncbi:fungal protein kinase-like protein [Phanerochaete sordida]|uniref:Fungal protein kinase-like protein n=1 Tax=Phanerochaete sordida TaxID=48140 RepID=A0A9P3G4K9_9APHY|nr:fungal protein kinase-like protein [Phanerochaete sordida]